MAARFSQLLSGHAMIAPFLKERWGWTDSDKCWRCEKGRRSREHLFKECSAWMAEIRELWTAAGKASGRKEGMDKISTLRVGKALVIESGRRGQGPATHQSGTYCRMTDILRQSWSS